MRIHLLLIIQIVCFFSISLNSPLYAQDFAGGSGTEADPYLVETPEHLNNVRNYIGQEHTDVHFRQIEHIDLGVPPWSENEGWVPIGTVDYYFYGSYDGNGFSILNLTIDTFNDSNGLFKIIREARVSGLTLENISIKSINSWFC